MPKDKKPATAKTQKDKKTQKDSVGADLVSARKNKSDKPDVPDSPDKPDKKSAKVSPTLKKIIDQIEKLSVLELAELVKALENKFGVSASAPVAAAAAGAAGTEADDKAQAEEKSEYDVILSSPGSNKIAVIKAIREVKPDLGLKDAKDLVDTAPKTILEKASKEQADDAKAKLESAGAQVELK